MKHATCNKRKNATGYMLHDTCAGGFTFIETLVAIAVLLLSVAAPLFLAAQGLRAARIARDQVIANYLAQEAIEYVRYRRDTNILQGNDGSAWLSGLDTCFGTNGCIIDPHQDSPDFQVTACTSEECSKLRFDDSSGVYSYDSGDPETKFTRTLKISYVGSAVDKEVEVNATISWQDGVLMRNFTLKDHLLNWQ